MKFLDKAEEDLIHKQSLKCLSEIGVLVRSKSVLKMLGDAGADIDQKAEIAKIPEEMIDGALKNAPKEIRLCGLEPKNDMTIPVDSIPYMATTGLAVYMTDFKTGKNRDTTRKDLADFARLADALEPVDFFWPCVTAGDVPQHTHIIHELWTAAQNQTKHMQGDSISALDAQKQIELASLIMGGLKELKRRPFFSVVSCPIAPLSFEKGAIEGQVEFAKAGIPITSLSMSLSGGTAPVTVAGTLVNANSENLASLVITQLSNAGAPHIYGSNSTPIDMRTGEIDYGAVENPFISVALGQMAKRYSLPCQISDWGLQDGELGEPTPFSELSSLTLNTFSGSDLAQGIGCVGSAKGASLEQMVIDAYVWKNWKGFLRKVEINEEKIALDVTKAVGHGNSFLMHPHTLKNYKRELFSRDRNVLEWEMDMPGKGIREAKAIVKKLLKEHKPAPLDKSIVKQGDELLKEYEKMIVA